MGIDAGFDMVPPLSKEAVDSQNWSSFIEEIKEHYKKDHRVEIKPNYIVFSVGEHPQLPFEGHKFLRFCSKITGRRAEGVEEYLQTVARIAKVKFGSRVRSWDEGSDRYGVYDWQEVNNSLRSYEQPDEPEIPTSNDQYRPNIDLTKNLELPTFSIQSITGKGRGLVACVSISQGQRILCEKPLFTSPGIVARDLMENFIATKLKALSKSEQRQFLSLHNNFPGKQPFSGIVRTNALPCGPDSVIGGVYPTLCFINHSCMPNAHHSWNSETKCETIYAIRSIEVGEEITICYVNSNTNKSRRLQLKESFGFDCDCKLCGFPLAEIQVSDARRQKIQSLDELIGEPQRVIFRRQFA